MKKENIKLLLFVITMTVVFFTLLSAWGIYQDRKQLEKDARENQIFKDGYEVGRFDQLNESAFESSCFNISKNSELNHLLEKHFKNCRDAKIMWAIAQAESHGDQDAKFTNKNKSVDCGWAQNNSVHRMKGETQEHFCDRMKIISENVALAKEIKDKQGWTAWTKFKTGEYLAYLK